jgi:hypothetical protein
VGLDLFGSFSQYPDGRRDVVRFDADECDLAYLGERIEDGVPLVRPSAVRATSRCR